MDKSFLRLVLMFFGLLMLTFASVAVWQLKVIGHGGFEFRYHRSHYQSIANEAIGHAPLEGDLKIAKVKVKGKKVEFSRLKRDDFMRSGNFDEPMVWLSRQKGNIVLWLETLDLGHAGQFGYAWSANGNVPEWRADDWGEFWSLGKPLEEGWWRIENRLN
jgi:hypothetical protein